MKGNQRGSFLKTIGLTVGALLVLPLSITAASSSKLSVEEGAKLIMDREVNRPVLSGETLSMEAQMYTNDEAIMDELKKISDAQNAYSDQQREQGFEASTYQQLYQYWYLLQAQKVTNKSAALAEEQLRLAKVRYNQGVISQGQLLQVEMSLNEALVAKEEMDRNVDQLRYKLNLDLGRDVDQELEIILKQFKTIERSKLNKKKMTEEVLDNHDSLQPLRQAITAYKNVLSKIDSLDVNQALKDRVAQAKKAVSDAQAVLDSLDPNDPDYQEKYAAAYANLKQAEQVLTEAEKALAEAEEDLKKAKPELKSYYTKQLNDAEKQLKKQKQHLEWMVHTSVDELKQLEDAINRYEDNVEKAEKLYKQAKARFDAGLATPAQVDEARLALENAELTLAGAKQSYLNAKTNYLLFLKGYLPSGGAGMQAGM